MIARVSPTNYIKQYLTVPKQYLWNAQYGSPWSVTDTLTVALGAMHADFHDLGSDLMDFQTLQMTESFLWVSR